MKMYREWAEFYDLLYGKQEQDKDIPFFLKLLKKYGGPVLECACGTGRVMIPIAKGEFEICGIDTSKDMLGVLREKISKLPKNVQEKITYERKDMRNFDLKRKFRTCVMPFTSLYHLETDSEMRKFFRCVHHHLEPGGFFIIDVFDFNPETPQGKFKLHAKVKDSKGRTITKYGKTVFGRNQVNNCWFRIVIEEKGKRKREIKTKFRLHYLFYGQMREMLETEGFKILNVYGNYDFKPYKYGKPYEKMIFVSKKI